MHLKNDSQRTPLIKTGLRNKAVRSLILLTSSRLLVLAPLIGFIVLSSTVNAEEGLGVITLTVSGLGQVVATLFLSPYLSRRFGSRGLVRIGLILFVGYIVSNVYPAWETLVPGSICLAFGTTLQFIGCGLYVTELSECIAEVTDTPMQVVLIRSFALITVAMQSGHLWANIVIAIVFGVNAEVSSDPIIFNGTTACGADFCNTDENKQILPMPEQWRMNVLAGIFCGLGALGIILLFFLEDFSKKSVEVDDRSYCSLVKGTLKMIIDKRMLLLTPISFYVGHQICFLIADYTQGFIGCILGIKFIGQIMMCFGAADMICSFVQTPLVRLVGRNCLLIIGALIQATVISIMLYWKPEPHNSFLLYLLAMAWGITDSILFVQVFAYYNILFPKDRESANSAALLWYALGCSWAYASSGLLCMKYKLYILAVLLALSCLGFGFLQFLLGSQPKPQDEPIKPPDEPIKPKEEAVTRF